MSLANWHLYILFSLHRFTSSLHVVCLCVFGWLDVYLPVVSRYIYRLLHAERILTMKNSHHIVTAALYIARARSINIQNAQFNSQPAFHQHREMAIWIFAHIVLKWFFFYYFNFASYIFFFSYDNRWNAEECAKHAWVSFVQNLAVISRCKWIILTEWSASVNLQRHRFVCVAVWRLRRMTLWRPCTVAATAKVHIWCVTGGCCRGMHNRPDQQLLKAKCCHACAFHGHTNRSLLHEQITVASEHCASIHSPRSIHRRQIALHFYYITRARFRAKYKRKNDLLACRHNADKSPHELDAQTEALTENSFGISFATMQQTKSKSNLK